MLDGVEDLRMKYVPLIYVDKLSDEAKAKYAAAHIDRAAAVGQRNGGAHFEVRPSVGLFCLAARATRAGLCAPACVVRGGASAAAGGGQLPRHTANTHQCAHHCTHHNPTHHNPTHQQPYTPTTTQQPHQQYLERLLKRSGSGFVAASGPTVADLALFDIVDLHCRPQLFPEEMKQVLTCIRRWWWS